MKKFIAILFICFAASQLQAVLPPDSPVTKVVNGKKYIVHTIVKGETLYKIAKKYQCTVADIQAVNKNTETLKIGAELLIPSKDVVKPVPIAIEKAQPAIEKETLPIEKVEYKTHIVKKGETLSKIAKSYGVSVAEIKMLNGLKTEAIKIDQVLKISILKKEEVKVVEPKTEPLPVIKTEEVKKPESNIGEKTPSNNPGMPEKPIATPAADKVSEHEESGSAIVADTKMDQSRNFVMHPSIPKGNIIVVINPANGKMVYCRVVDNYSSADYKGAQLLMTRAVSDKLGLDSGKGDVNIKYATP